MFLQPVLPSAVRLYICRAKNYAAYRRGDSAKGDAVIARCVSAADMPCMTGFWNDVLSGGIAPNRPGTGALVDAYLGVMETGNTQWPAPTLRSVAQVLRQRGQVALAFRADIAAAQRK